MPSRDLVYLLDILGAAHLVQEFIEGVDWQAFEADLMRQSAVMRQIEVMGEATKRLSEEFRASYPNIPWRNIAGMRDILIHAYDHVDLDEVWKAATVSIPALIQQIEPLIPPSDES
jgi:uncharacterized protein with HEPN domain